MTRYAEGTAVSPDKSRAEIERTLARYGASAFGYAYEEHRAVVFFRAHDRHVKFILPLPSEDEILRGAKRRLTPPAVRSARDAETRRRWRSLAMAIKAKLEIVASGITSFESEFLAHVVLPDGQTVGEAIGPQIALSYRDGGMPPLLGYSGKDGE